MKNGLIFLPALAGHVEWSLPLVARLFAGEISVPAAIGAAAILLIAAVAFSWRLPREFLAVLAVYLAVTTAYSVVLKSRPVADVITLAGLYTARIVAGAALAAIALSQWFLAFSIFFFLLPVAAEPLDPWRCLREWWSCRIRWLGPPSCPVEDTPRRTWRC